MIFTHFFKFSPSFLSAPDQKKHRKNNNTMTTTNIDISAPKPKVNGEQMGLFSGKTVQLVLETTSNSEGGSVLKGKAADGMEVTAVGPVFGRGAASRFIEVEGVVTGPQEIKATNVASFGESVDLFAYNEMCKMLHAKGREMIL